MKMNKAEQLLINAGLDKTHWGRRIIAAELQCFFSIDDRDDAGNWTTCACGKLDQRIPRSYYHNDGRPDDSMLFRLGEEFHHYISFDDPLSAADTLIKIEKRASEILREINDHNSK